MTILSKPQSFLKTLTPLSSNSISTFSPLSHHPQLPSPPSQPPPSTANPIHHHNWRNPLHHHHHHHQHSSPPLDFLNPTSSSHHRTQSIAKKDAISLTNLFADWITSRRFGDIKQHFENWVNSFDLNGKLNVPNLHLFNHYLRAHFMDRSSAMKLLDVVFRMEGFGVEPNTTSFNIVLKAMCRDAEVEAAVKLLERMLHSGKESQPDEESFDLVLSLLFQHSQIDTALKYMDVTLKSGFMLSTKVFTDFVQSCVRQKRLDNLVIVIEKCKAMDQNKALSPPWNLWYDLAEVSILNDNSRLAFQALGFMARWIQQGENARSPVFLSVEEGLVISALATAARTYDSCLLDASWAILKRSLRDKKAPMPETYLAKINALASMGSLSNAVSTLSELERTYSSYAVAEEDLLSPFTSLYPLVVACTKQGFETLDLVYFELENLSRADPPVKSVAALNCIILGCANIWDLDRAYQTFEAISSKFESNPNIHSYNAMISAFGKLRKTFEARRVFEHLRSLGVKPNAMSYSLLVDAHLIKRDPKAALNVLNSMVEAGFEPSKETLKKVKRRCIRECDHASMEHLDSLAKQCNIFLGGENRRNMLFKLQYAIRYAS